MATTHAHRFAAAVAALCITSCATERATGPVGGAPLAARTQQAPGLYAVEFYQNVNNVLQPVTSIVASTGGELILGGRVTDVDGNAVASGQVTFEYCSRKGLPPNDITRADEAPSSECASGKATWKQLLTLWLNADGTVYMNFGVVRLPRTIGFRIRFKANGGAVQSGISPPRDFTWVASGQE